MIVMSVVMLLAAARIDAAPLPNFTHVYIIVMENHEFSDIIGSPSAPYINSLAQKYGLGTAYTGITHPSLPNYMSLTGGDTFFADDCIGCVVSAPNIADQVEASGRTWKGYFEDMGAPCVTNDNGSGQYTVHHNPFVHYDDIVNNASRCQAHVVDFSNFGADLSAGTVPSYVFIAPNLCSDMHDCSIATGDAWLQTVVPAILGTPDFATSVLFLVWDEGTSSIGGGGRVPMLAISPLVVTPGFQSAVAENHFSLLRTIQDAWGFAPLAQTGTATAMTEYFTSAITCQDTLTLSDVGGTLNLGFTIGSATPATWSTWLVAESTPFKLWSLPIPAVSPAVFFNLPVPGFPQLGTVYVVTILTPTAGTSCGDLKSVNTGP
jgi:acid phosphatase